MGKACCGNTCFDYDVHSGWGHPVVFATFGGAAGTLQWQARQTKAQEPVLYLLSASFGGDLCDKFIDLKITTKDNNLIIKISNNTNGNVNKVNGRFITTKNRRHVKVKKNQD